MTEPTDLNDDAELAAIYRSVRAEPDAALDAQIAAAAHASTSVRRPNRRRFVVGLGAALSATVALALLVPVLLDVRQTPEAMPEVPPAEAASAEEPSPVDAFGAVASYQIQPERRLAEKSVRAMTEGATRDVAVPAAGENFERALAPSAPRASLAMHELSEPTPACRGGTERLRIAGVMVCVSEESIEVHDLDAGECVVPLTLARESGEVSARRAERGLEISIDDVARFRLHCEEGAWRVETLPPEAGR